MLETLIHPTQTGFVKDRSILDNIFTFWEAISVGSSTRARTWPFYCFDFEKAYEQS